MAVQSDLLIRNIHELNENKKERERNNRIEEASFILQLNQSFIQNKDMSEVETLLEKQTFYGMKEPIITDDTRQKFVNYLAYFDALTSLVLNEVLALDYIDDLMAYRFFLAVNNKEVQEKELLKFPGDYRGCFKLYKRWSAYRKDKDIEIHGEKNALDKWEYFYEYANISFLDSITYRQLDKDFPLTDKQKLDIAELIYDTDQFIYPVLFVGDTILGTEECSRDNSKLILPTILDPLTSLVL